MAWGLVFASLCTAGAPLIAQQRISSENATPPAQTFGKQQASPPPSDQILPQASSDYVIGPEDVLGIDVFQVADLSGLTLRVSNDGTIVVPLLGVVQAAGLTTSQLARTLAAKWGKKYLQNPEVSVIVKQFLAKPVTVMGAVERPGPYYLTGPRTLVEVLGMAGGLVKRSFGVSGPGHFLYLTRQGGFGQLQMVPGMKFVAPDELQIDVSKLLYSNDPRLNIPVEPLDVISVERAGVVYVAGGGVQKPGGFVLEDRDDVTVIQALAMAQGLSPVAAKRYARIIRQGSNGIRVEIPVDLEKVEKGKAPDPVLADNDILFVPDSKQKAALKRAVDVTVSTISGLLIFGGL